MHLRTYLDQRFKLTVYCGQDYGELIELQEEPGELFNRWDDPAYADVRARLFESAIQAELKREPRKLERIAIA